MKVQGWSWTYPEGKGLGGHDIGRVGGSAIPVSTAESVKAVTYKETAAMIVISMCSFLLNFPGLRLCSRPNSLKRLSGKVRAMNFPQGSIN